MIDIQIVQWSAASS